MGVSFSEGRKSSDTGKRLCKEVGGFILPTFFLPIIGVFCRLLAFAKLCQCVICISYKQNTKMLKQGDKKIYNGNFFDITFGQILCNIWKKEF